MTAKEILTELQSLGTEQNLKIYSRHGSAAQMFGVSYAHMGAIAKRIKRDQRLAVSLFKSPNMEARIVASQIADPEAVDGVMLDKWVKDSVCYMDADAIAHNLASKSPDGKRCALAWVKDKGEAVQRCGWSTLAGMLKQGHEFTPKECRDLLSMIEKGIHKAPNRAREAMNWLLIALGSYRDDLRDDALAVAKRIGPVDVDHGDTGCKTPNAYTYILKTASPQGAAKPVASR
jgi:3-methyladenine DNA glycosylase AlkD